MLSRIELFLLCEGFLSDLSCVLILAATTVTVFSLNGDNVLSWMASLGVDAFWVGLTSRGVDESAKEVLYLFLCTSFFPPFMGFKTFSWHLAYLVYKLICSLTTIDVQIFPKMTIDSYNILKKYSSVNTSHLLITRSPKE